MTVPFLTKSDYLRYLQCPRYLWLWVHERHAVQDLLDPNREWLFEEGNLVEGYARRLFPSGTLVPSFHEPGARDTRARIAEGATCLFQATALADGLLAMADVFAYDAAARAWNIYEVKGSTEVKDEHLHDVCFQKLAFERAGYTVGTLSVIHINSDYVRHGAIDPQGLFTIEDVTQAASRWWIWVARCRCLGGAFSSAARISSISALNGPNFGAAGSRLRRYGFGSGVARASRTLRRE
jgi:hypothetical protein